MFMKKLQKSVPVLYRFRCERCRSKFEMTEEEKRENDIKFTDDWDKQLKNQEEYGWEPTTNNPHDKFDCPVCGVARIVMRNDMHRYSVMDDGTELMDY